jgi:uncharacterized protein YkwD
VAVPRKASTRTPRLLAIVATALLVLVAAGCDPNADPRAAGALAPVQEQVRLSVNDVRATVGAPLLVVNDELQARAQAWAEHLAAIGDVQHTPKLGAGLTIAWRVLGENVGLGSSVDIICDAFLKSPPHRANIVDPRFTLVGIGVAVDQQGRSFVVQQFAAL